MRPVWVITFAKGRGEREREAERAGVLSNALRILCEILQNIQKHKSITGSREREREGRMDMAHRTKQASGEWRDERGEREAESGHINQRLVVG